MSLPTSCMTIDCIFLQANYIAVRSNQHTESPSQAHQSHIAIMHCLTLKAILLVFCTFFGKSHANPAAYGMCQASCAVVVAACYIANGARFGTVRAVGAPPALLRCNTAFGTCQATCSSVWRAHANGPTMLDQLAQQMGDMSLAPPKGEEGALDGIVDGFAKMNIK